jgi:hypothetical protein
MRKAITFLATAALCAALTAVQAPFAPLANAEAGQGDGRGQGKGQGNGQGKGREKSQGGTGGEDRGHRHGHDDGDRDGHHGHDDHHRHRDRGKWSGDWEVNAFVSAGFNLLALHQLLGGNLAPLHVGAQPLPPGIRKNLARGKPLPPGIAKKLPPPALVPVLPVVVGHEWRVVGRDLLLIQAGTLLVAEIIRDALD